MLAFRPMDTNLPPVPATTTPSWPRAWRVFRNRHFSLFKTYVNRERRTVVVLNPKVGTKSFRQALTDQQLVDLLAYLHTL